MAQRLYLMQRFPYVDLEPAPDINIVPPLARQHAQAWRGFGWWNADGTLNPTPPTMPTKFIALAVRGDWHIVAVASTDFTWFDDYVNSGPGRLLQSTINLAATLTSQQRNQLNNWLNARGLTVNVTASDTIGEILRRIARRNAILDDKATADGSKDFRAQALVDAIAE